MDEPQQRSAGKRAAEYAGERDLDAFWRATELPSEPATRRWYIPTLLLLVVLSVPWYWKAGVLGALYFGMPAWIWISLGCTLGVSALTALGALRFWRDGN